MTEPVFKFFWQLRQWQRLEQVAADRERFGFSGAKVDRFVADAHRDATQRLAGNIIQQYC